MNARYFGMVALVPDQYTVVINKGSEHNVQTGQEFLIVGVGEVILDPDTGEELEKLEIVRGKVEATHVQPRIATLKSCIYKESSNERQIKKVRSRGTFALFGPEQTETETIKPGERRIQPLTNAERGDFVIIDE